MKHGGRYEIDMCSGPLAGKILLFALPLMASTMLQLLFNAADVAVVGRFAGQEAQGAVGSNTALINLIINLFIGFSVGTNVVVARDLGSGHEERVRDSVHTAITVALLGGTLLAGASLLFVRQMLVWMSSPGDIIDLATVYLRIYFLGTPGNLVYNFGAALLRAKGDTRRPLYILTGAGLLNLVLNLLFVVVFRWDVAGVGLATILSQYLSAVLVLWCLIREKGAFHLDLRKLTIHWDVARRMLCIGLPAGLQGIVFSLSNVTIQSGLNSFDSAALVAGSSVAVSIENFVYMSMNAFYQAAISFMGQNFGAGQFKRVDRCALLCQGYALAFGLVLGNLVYFFGRPLAALFAPDEPEVVAQAMLRLGIISRTHFIGGVMDVAVGMLRGLGYSFVPMVVSLVGVCGFRLIWVATVFQSHRSPQCLYWVYPITWTIAGAVLVALYLVLRRRSFRERAENGAPAHVAVEGRHGSEENEM